mmetsp:Transcript_5520/g.18270  ORF Transcript_5520/g.18270 Transcript_5520/m.18270 type:complete len:103 (-) Transcript_5520:577-885(-)
MLSSSRRHVALLARNHVRLTSTQPRLPTPSEFSMFRALPKQGDKDGKPTIPWKQLSMSGSPARSMPERKMYNPGRWVRLNLHPDPEQLRYMRLFARSGINCT